MAISLSLPCPAAELSGVWERGTAWNPRMHYGHVAQYFLTKVLFFPISLTETQLKLDDLGT